MTEEEERDLDRLVWREKRRQQRARKRAERVKVARAVASVKKAITKVERAIYKANARARGRCNDCGAQAQALSTRCPLCAEKHRVREKLADRYGRPDYKPYYNEFLKTLQKTQPEGCLEEREAS